MGENIKGCGCSSVVEHRLPKPGVGGSSPLTRFLFSAVLFFVGCVAPASQPPSVEPVEPPDVIETPPPVPRGEETLPPAGTVAYEVRRGDTLYGIARRFKTTVGALKALNKGRLKKGLKAGDVILVPSPSVPDFVAGEGFLMPAEGKVVVGFGERREGARIEGVDVEVEEGAAVKASRTGVVVYVSDNFGSYGGVVVMRHGDYRTVYGYLEEIYVKAGQKVGRGMVIGRAGKRLHFRIYRGREALSPLTLVRKK